MREDHLKEDPIFPGQDWAVVSYVNPKDAVLKKSLYYVNNFMVHDINKSLTASSVQMVKLLKSQMRSKIDDLLDKLKDSRDPEDKHMGQLLEKRYREMEIDEDEFVDECRRTYELDDEELSDKYKMYISENRQRLDLTFDESHGNMTSLRGFKVRGAFKQLKDARDHGQFLRDNVENGIHTFVVAMGKWFPLDVEVDEIGDQEYMLPELNKMMGKYHEGIHARNQHYNERKKDLQEKAHDHNQMNTKDRLQEKLRKQRHEKMRREVEEQQRLVTGGASSASSASNDTPAKKRRKKKNTRNATTEVSQPTE